jgi:hypothetical protein
MLFKQHLIPFRKTLQRQVHSGKARWLQWLAPTGSHPPTFLIDGHLPHPPAAILPRSWLMAVSRAHRQPPSHRLAWCLLMKLVPKSCIDDAGCCKSARLGLILTWIYSLSSGCHLSPIQRNISKLAQASFAKSIEQTWMGLCSLLATCYHLPTSNSYCSSFLSLFLLLLYWRWHYATKQFLFAWICPFSSDGAAKKCDGEI